MFTVITAIFCFLIAPILAALAWLTPKMLNLATAKNPAGKYSRKTFLLGLVGAWLALLVVCTAITQNAKTAPSITAAPATLPKIAPPAKVVAAAIEPTATPVVKVTGSKDYLQDASLDSKKLDDPAQIDKLVSSIPNLKQGLIDNGLVVNQIEYGHYTEYDIKSSDGVTQKEDVEYNFYTNDPKDGSPCELWNHFNIDKRGKLWLPRSRTANYLMTGVCSAPN